jgi:4-diphosphocytidyl-2-C-methyl-D-erythritol kinase
LAEARPILRIPAYAKVNLALEILGRRDDGFHEIVSVTQTISLHDTLEASDAHGLRVEMAPPVVSAGENLVARAASLLASTVGRQPLARIGVRKRIPLAAGLGGGSSDAAAALRLLDRLWRANLPAEKLGALAATLGSDVSLFLPGGTALIRGRGEIVEPLPAAPTVWLALACPAFDVPDKTRALYQSLDPADWTDGRATRQLATMIRGGRSILAADLINTFDRPASRVYPGFADLRARLADAAGAPLHLTGAGPSLFALFATRTDAEAGARRMRRVGNVPVFVTRAVPRRSEIRPVRAAAPPGVGLPDVARPAPDPGYTPR